MAKRRMISCTIVGSNKFIMLPKAAQALYMHFVANADDDGIVEADSVMRLVRARRRDLEALASAGYVTVIEQASNIVYIPGWQSFNYIPKGRGTPSEYRETLIRHFPAIENALIKPRKADNLQQNDGITEAKQNPIQSKGSQSEPEANTEHPASVSAFPAFLGRVGGVSEKPTLKMFLNVAQDNHIKLSVNQISAIYDHLEAANFMVSGRPIDNLGKVLRWYEKNQDAIEMDPEYIVEY